MDQTKKGKLRVTPKGYSEEVRTTSRRETQMNEITALVYALEHEDNGTRRSSMVEMILRKLPHHSELKDMATS